MRKNSESGYTIIELVVGLTVFAIVAMSLLGLFTALISSSVLIKRKSVALTLATNRMEYIKSLPYNNLAVAGGSFYSPSPLPADTYDTINGVRYRTRVSINYVDDAYDGCGSYPNATIKNQYCKNQPAPTGAPSTDTNAKDYKIAHITTYDNRNVPYAEVDTQISARVAETASTTGALFVKVIDQTGSPVSGANIRIQNATVSPAVDLNDSSDSNGIAIFYDLPPDTTNYDYMATVSKTGYSTLNTIPSTSTLTATYPSQSLISQASSFVTLTINPMNDKSIVVETTDLSGGALPNVKVHIKGGYKKYTATANTEYYYNNISPSDTRVATDGSGLAGLTGLAPGPYIFCGDSGSTSCSAGSTTYYLAAVIPYSGTNAFNPIAVPSVDANTTPSPAFAYGANNFTQKVRLMLTTDSSFPRIATVSPDDVSLSGGAANSFNFSVTGVNLPCSSNAASCGTSVVFKQGGTSYTASCTGTSGTSLNCLVNMSTASAGMSTLQLSVGAKTLSIPAGSLIGGINVTP